MALEGHFTEHHLFMVGHLLTHLNELERHVEEISSRIAQCFEPLLDDDRIKRLDAIAGVDRATIENVVAEIGVDMAVFPDEHHLSSWAGISPGNEQSAGKRLRNRTTRKNRWLRRALTEAAWAAGRTKSSYLGAQYRRLAPRRGKKRALVAVGHSLLVIFYHMLKHEGLEYKDLGVDYFDRLEPERLRSYLVKRLQRLGYRVTLWRSRREGGPEQSEDSGRRDPQHEEGQVVVAAYRRWRRAGRRGLVAAFSIPPQ